MLIVPPQGCLAAGEGRRGEPLRVRRPGHGMAAGSTTWGCGALPGATQQRTPHPQRQCACCEFGLVTHLCLRGGGGDLRWEGSRHDTEGSQRRCKDRRMEDERGPFSGPYTIGGQPVNPSQHAVQRPSCSACGARLRPNQGRIASRCPSGGLEEAQVPGKRATRGDHPPFCRRRRATTNEWDMCGRAPSAGRHLLLPFMPWQSNSHLHFMYDNTFRHPPLLYRPLHRSVTKQHSLHSVAVGFRCWKTWGRKEQGSMYVYPKQRGSMPGGDRRRAGLSHRSRTRRPAWLKRGVPSRGAQSQRGSNKQAGGSTQGGQAGYGPSGDKSSCGCLLVSSGLVPEAPLTPAAAGGVASQSSQ